MSKKKGTGHRPRGKRSNIGRAKLAAAALALCVVAAGVAATRYDPVRRVVGLRPLTVAPLQQGGQLPLSKEYVYAGGRLVAMEEATPAPTPTPTGPPPTNLVAYTSSVIGSTATVTVTWSAPSSGTVASYVIERANVAGQFAPVGQPVTAPTTTFNDTSAAEGSAYLYQVKAFFAGGGTSAYSNSDMATAVAYTNDPLQAGVTVVKAAHLTQLRRAVDAVRALANVGQATWQTNPSPAPGGSILAAHSLELRTNLNPALAALGMTQMLADPTLAVGLPIKAAHIQAVRDKIR